MNLNLLFQEVRRGKHLSRTLHNVEFSKRTVSGTGIDLGAKSRSASYYRFLNVGDDTMITFSDLFAEEEGILRVDLEKEIPVEEATQDFLILNNVLEHLYDYRTCLREAHRVLKVNGRLLGSVPFLMYVHPDPDDHFRYTASTLRRLFTEVGFREITIRPLGFGPISTAASFIGPIIRIKPLIFLLYATAIQIDKLLGKLFGDRPQFKSENFPLAYFFEVKK